MCFPKLDHVKYLPSKEVTKGSDAPQNAIIVLNIR
jgi:hypothetical protein